MNRRRILSALMAFTGVEWASTPIPRLCNGGVAPPKWTLRRRFIDVTPMELSKVAYYTVHAYATPMIFNWEPPCLCGHSGYTDS